MGIDWNWVEKELQKTERISSINIPESNKTILKEANECVEKAEFLARPDFISIEKTVLNLGPDSIEIEGGEVFWGRRLSSYLTGAMRLKIFLVTLGVEIENTASLLMGQGEHLRGYLLDRIGSLAVESLAEAFEQDIRAEYLEKGLSVSARFSPGYCDWPIEEQLKLAKILNFSKLGVSLTNTCMMVPKKSISAMVGIGPAGLFSVKKSQCVLCDKKDCGYKRIF